MLKIYLDNDVSSAITRRDLEKAELDALDLLIDCKRRKRIILDTSRQSPREMERAPAQYHGNLKKGLVELGQAAKDHKFLGSYTLSDQYGGSITNPLVTDIVDEPLYSQVLATGLKSDDSKHLMYASHNHYERFVTCDGNFLNRRADLERLCPSIRIQRPSELVAEFSFIASTLKGNRCGDRE